MDQIEIVISWEKQMRRGCLSVGTVNCDVCKSHIPYPERYVVVDEDANGKEIDRGGKSVRYCVECAKQKGYARYKEIKGEMVLTFLPDGGSSIPEPSADKP